jgi:hypothetical protein
MGSGMENPDLPPPPIYRRLFHVPKGGGKSGFYCTLKSSGLIGWPCSVAIRMSIASDILFTIFSFAEEF